MSADKDMILQFAPWESFVSPTFWHKLAELKLDHDRLSDSKRSIAGHYTNRNASGCLMEVDYTAYNRWVWKAGVDKSITPHPTYSPAFQDGTAPEV